MSRIYGWTPATVLGLPMRLFWEYSGQVPRLLADEQRHDFQVFASVQGGGERVQEFQLALDKIAPDPVTMTARAQVEASSQRDPDAASQLRSLAG